MLLEAKGQAKSENINSGIVKVELVNDEAQRGRISGTFCIFMGIVITYCH